MGQIYTGYFDKISKYLACGLNVKGITRFPPDTLSKYGLINIDFLAPDKDLLLSYKAGEISKEEFTEAYNRFLNKNEAFIHDIVTWALTEETDTIWCCFEKPSDFCHRHLLAEFINTRGWTKIKEFK